MAGALTSLLKRAVRDGWNSRYDSRYKHVKVLLTYWADSGDTAPGAAKAASSLANVFKQVYDFGVQEWLIPSVDEPQQALAAKLQEWVRYFGHEDNLLIFWYGGAARKIGSGAVPAIWHGE